jgi:predicted PurR-regulated permease PerM
MKILGENPERERVARGKLFRTVYLVLSVAITALLLWKLKALLLPIVVGALMAYLFRPLKDRFQVNWLFACVGLGIFLLAHQARKMIPDERQKLELKVRLKYKLNEKYQEIVGTHNPEKQKGTVAQLVSREVGPMMDKFNGLLDLDPGEIETFEKYRQGYKGQPPTDSRYVEYFNANQTTSVYTSAARAQASLDKGSEATVGEAGEQSQDGLMEELSIWILAPLIFVFLGFDNGQMRRYFIGLVPNRYFELSLTVLDELDEAIGKYLRGTLLECSLVGATLAIGLFLLGIPLSVALCIGIVSGLANAIPFLGPVIGLVIGLAYSLIGENIIPLIPGLASQDLAIYVLVLIGITHILDNVVFQPFVLGNAVNLHPLVVTVAIISGSVMMGVWGMLLAIPTVVVVKTAVETLFKELKDYRII